MSPRNVEKDLLFREARKQQILDAALKVFIKQGIGSAKISDIAVEAGVTQGHIYNFFESKAYLFMELTKQLQKNYSDQLEYAANLEGSARDKLLWLADTYLDRKNGIAEVTLFLLQMQTSEVVTADEKAAINLRAQVNFQSIVRIIAEGQESGQFRSGDTSELAFKFFSMLRGFVLEHIRGIHSSILISSDDIIELIEPRR